MNDDSIVKQDSPLPNWMNVTLGFCTSRMNRIILSVVLTTCISASAANSWGQTFCTRPGDEVWLVSARNLGNCCSPNILQCQRLHDGVWINTPCTDLFDAKQAPDSIPVVYVHGYQTNLADAQLRGIQVYQNLFGMCPAHNPIRYVIWAWKSERETRRVVREFTEKSQHALELGDAFAITLNQLQTKPPVVIAYSLGAQVCLSALVRSQAYNGSPVHLAFIAAATDCGFDRCCLQMQGCGNIAKSYVFSNRGDIAIRAARLSCRLARGRKPEKLEQIAPRFPTQLGEVNIVDITPVSTRQHSIIKYTSIPVVACCINELLAFADSIYCPVAAAGIGQAIDEVHPAIANINSSRNICIKR